MLGETVGLVLDVVGVDPSKSHARRLLDHTPRCRCALLGFVCLSSSSTRWRDEATSVFGLGLGVSVLSSGAKLSFADPDYIAIRQLGGLSSAL